MDDRNDWHSIRPWRPSLALSVREITSVSVTFILSSPYSAADSLRSSPASSDDGYDPGAHPQPDGDSDDSDSASDAGNAPAQPQVVADVLNKGLSVKVNGIPWQRVLIRMDDEVDEAVIILFGLMPGRQYDVELGVMPRERSMRGLITTGEHFQSLSCLPMPVLQRCCVPRSDMYVSTVRHPGEGECRDSIGTGQEPHHSLIYSDP